MMWVWTCFRFWMLLHLERRVRDGWVWRRLYGGSEAGSTWRVEGGIVNKEDEDENAISELWCRAA